MTALRAAQADAIRDVVRACPGVVDLGTGVATYLPGRTVVGVRRRDDHVEIHLVVDGSAPLPDIAARVRDAARDLVDEQVDVVIEDVVVGGDRGPGAGA